MKDKYVESCTKYTCGVCGQQYDTIEERNKCEAKCLHDKYEAEKKFKEEKLRQEKEARKKEVDMAFENYLNLRKEYVNDYGSYSVMRTFDDPSVWIW